MNKLFIVALAVCLVSVHAFVKRDAEKTDASANFEKIKEDAEKFFTDASGKVKDFFESDKVKEALDPEKVKKQLEDAMDAVKKLFDTNTAATTEKKE